MDITEFISIVSNTCFPVAVSAYLLIRLEKQINNLTSSVNILNTIVSSKLGVVVDNTTKDEDASKKIS